MIRITIVDWSITKRTNTSLNNKETEGLIMEIYHPLVRFPRERSEPEIRVTEGTGKVGKNPNLWSMYTC